MKKQKEKRGEVLKPSPNEEAHILQSERERRKKLRLKQIRDQEKAFSRKVLQDARTRKTRRLQHLTRQLKGQWQNKHDEQEAQLEKQYQENLAEFGLGHMVAVQDKTDYSKQELTEEDRQRAAERYKTAMQQMLCDKAKMNEWEMERTKARERAMETERLRAARIAALPPPVDPIADISLTKDQTGTDQKDIQSFGSSHFHLHPSVHVERALDLSQEDARLAAKDEEDRLQGIVEDVEREKAEQLEKARLRHKHALAFQQLEEDHKKLLNELDSLERRDRHRRQEAVAKIPVRIFQPPHKRLEDADERQRELEQAFEDMYMAETGYTGDVTIALEPSPPHPSRTASEASGQSALEVESGDGERSAGVRQASSDLPGSSGVVPDSSIERVEQQREPGEEPTGGPSVVEPPVVPKQDPLRRLLQTIERQREQWLRRRPSEERQPSSAGAAATGIPLAYGPGETAHRRRQQLRIPDTVAFSGDESVTEVEPGKEEVEEDRERLAVAGGESLSGGYHSSVSFPPPDGSGGGRTLLHPLEAAQRSRTTTPAEISPSPQLTQQEALLKQQRLKLQLQQQVLLEQQLEQQLQQYHRQLSRDIASHPEAPIETLVSGEKQRTPDKIFLKEPLRGGPPFEDPVSREPGSGFTSHGIALPAVVPAGASREESPLTDAPESSSLGSVTSETLTEFSSDFRRTLEAARATAERAALSRENESATLKHLSVQPVMDPSSSSTLSLQSEELRSVPSRSTVSSTGVALSSDLSVTAALSRTSQHPVLSRDFGRIDRPVSGALSPFYSDVTDTASVAAAPSLLTKTSQNLGLFRPSSSNARTFSVLPSGTRMSPDIPPAVPGGRMSIERSGGLGIASSVSASSSETAPRISRASFPSQPRQLTHTSDYLDYYRQKIEEERQLFEAQRNRIRQRQNEQMKRYGDLLNKKASPAGEPQAYQTMVHVTDSGPPVVPDGRLSLGSKNDENKENQGNLANSTRFQGQEKLENLSRRLDSFEKSLNRGDDSNGGHPSQRSRNAFHTLPSSVSTSSYSSKPFSTSGLSYASTGTDYVSLPRAAAVADIQGSAGSTLSSLSELTEMMTRLTSTSEDATEADENNSSAYAVAGQSVGRNGPASSAQILRNTVRPSACGPQIVSSEGNQSSRTTPGQPYNVPSSVGSSYGVTTSADFRGATYDGALRSGTWYAPPGTSPSLSGAMSLVTRAAGASSTSGSVEKQRFVSLDASASFPLGGIEGKALEAAGKRETNDVLSNGDQDESPISGHANSELVESSSLTSLSSGTLRSGTSGRLDYPLAGSGHREPPSSERSSSSDGSPENPSDAGSQHSDKESIPGVSVGIVGDSSERSDNGVSLQDAFLRRKGDFVKLSKARVQMAKAKRFQVKPRVKVKQIGRRATVKERETKLKS